MPEPTRILVVDDDRDLAELVIQFLRRSETYADAAVETVDSHDLALAAMRERSYDVAFFDHGLGALDGLALLRDVRQRKIGTPVVVLTSRGAEDVAVEAMKAGAADYLSKTNVSVEALERTIRYALTLRAEERQREQAEAALRASEERFRALVENSSDALLLLDGEGRITFTTQSSVRHLGWRTDELVGRLWLDFVHPDDREGAMAHLAEAHRRSEARVSAEVRLLHADRSFRTMEGFAVNRLNDPLVGAIVVNARDVSDRRRLEDQLRGSQKMEAIGQLAGGVAHDFNNLLTAILGYCNLMLEDVSHEDPLRHDLEEIRSAGERAAALTRQLLAFSRRQMLHPQVVDVNTLVSQMEKLLRRMLSEGVELVTVLAPDLEAVKADPASIEQILLNIAVNARDAMPDGGRLTIETMNVELDGGYSDTHITIVPGRYVMLAIGDTGVGMDKETRTHIFEPFFTTKEQGKGTGLGLATVYGIVKQSGGYIWVHSEIGEGTVFKVYLPLAEASPESVGEEQPDAAQKERGWETVLLVEDEDTVRALAREVLRRHGYVVIEANHGLDALLLTESHAEGIHLMITDLVMPHMGGRELAEHLSASRPQMKVLFISGYTDHVVMSRAITPGSWFLQKPFTPDVFARKVREVLDSSGHRP